MNPSTAFTTVSGRQIDLTAPRAEDIDFDDIAEQLSKEARYNGATPNTIYFVAQHLVLGCDWLLLSPTTQTLIAEARIPFDFGEDAPLCDDPERRRIAAYYLCHDFHEAYLKDDTTPKKRAGDAVAKGFGHAYGLISEAYGGLAERFDAAIHEAAGLAWPMPADIAEIVHDIDRRMLVTEWKALRPGHDLPGNYADVQPLPIKIEPYSWRFCLELLSDRMRLLLPAVRKRINP